MIQTHNIEIEANPIKLICHFRNNIPLPELNLKKHYKNSLKASTAIRYGKKGASKLTVEMSIHNIDDMLTNFIENNRKKYLGSEDFNSDDLGYSFLISEG